MTRTDPTAPAEILPALWWAGVRAVDGEACVSRALRDDPVPRPDLILGVGKAAVAMCRAAVAHFGPGIPILAVTKTGHAGDASPGFEVIEAAHPVPDETSLEAGRRLLEAVRGAARDDHLLLLVSGGASALAEMPETGLSLDDLARITREMLGAGLDIAAMNVRRRRLSQIKGGRLLGGFGGSAATVLAISDVEGDSISVIGSGIGDCPPDPRFVYAGRIVASNAIARAAVAAEAEARGLALRCNDETLYADVELAAAAMGKRLREGPPGLYLWGGEPTVVLPPEPGRGGRNQALALLLAREIAGRDGIAALVAGTDGTDGPTDAAGGIVDGTDWEDGPGTAALAAADSGSYLEARGRLFRSGPTGTNVMDLALALKR